MTSNHKQPAKQPERHLRHEFRLARLRQADGPGYDELCREVVAAFPERNPYVASIRGVRAVRRVLFEGYATTEPDETVWLTPAGWQGVSELPQMAGNR